MILVNLNKSWPQVLAGSRTALDVALGAWARKHGRVKLSYPHRAATALAEGCGEGAAARARDQHRQHAVRPAHRCALADGGEAGHDRDYA